MQQKIRLRKKYFNLRKKKYFEINKDFFLPLVNLIKSNCKKKKLNIALYYPANFEVNIIGFLENKYLSKKNTLLPAIEGNSQMNFFPWKKNKVLFVNKFGLLEPIKAIAMIPDVIIVPLLSYDKEKYRLGYGKGFYDRYLRNIKKVYPKTSKVPRPDNWSGWILKPAMFEFWLEGPNRIHERLKYFKEQKKWVKKLFNP